MPYSIRKLPNKDLYRVYNTQTKVVHSYSTTLENAEKQVKLLHMVDAGVPLKKQGGAITDIDRTSTGVMRVKLNDPAKNFLKDKLVPLITNTTIRVTDSRKNSGTGRSQVFGYGNIRGKGFGEFKNNTAYPDLYRALLIFGMKIVPDYIPFTAIQVNHNYKTKKHIDGNNIGLSLAVSFGDFTGGELVIGTNAYQTKEHPVIFNGALTEHFNKPIKGDRYSLVFFVNAPKKYSDAEVYGLHNKLVSKIKLMKGEGLIGGSIETDRFEETGVVSLPEFRSVKLNLPTYMYKRLPDIKGRPPPYRYKLVIPITSSRNLSSRKQETSLNINQKAVARPIVDIAENADPPNLDDFSPADKAKIQEYYVKVKTNERMNPDEIDRDYYEIKQRGRPLPCSGASKPKAVKFRPPPVSKKVETSIVGLPSSSSSSAVAKVSSERASSISAPSVASSNSDLNSDDAELMINDYEAFKKKFNIGQKKGKKSGKGLENNISTNNNKMANTWVQYVKDFAAKNGMSYRDALRDPACKAGYKKGGAVMKKGRGVVDEVGDQDLISIAYDDSELGANAGKKYISL
jgi:hypothetical protein